jgi:23S rRNA (pseudouridine1915-N3)-methyltransferase
MPGWVNEAVAEYQKRLPADMALHVEELKLPRRGKTDTTSLMDEEAAAFRKKLAQFPGAHVVALDVQGRQYSTEKLSTRMQGLRDQGQDLALLVGGPDGLAPELLDQAHERWSLSALTLPHPLVRILVAEQVYRCWSIQQGHPYHR